MVIKIKNINAIQEGDCLGILQKIPSNSIDLIYLDPPFFTGRKQRLKDRDRMIEFTFDDLWESNQEYGEFLYVRMMEMRRILGQTGSLFVHCDKRAHHIVRALLDRVFKEDQFRSEIIWYYKRWSNAKKGYYLHTKLFTFIQSQRILSLIKYLHPILRRQMWTNFFKIAQGTTIIKPFIGRIKTEKTLFQGRKKVFRLVMFGIYPT